ncbi:unnamed protein product [Urochloa decumbens]|uniref:Protein kinase domain-containing protein n=1 Tax=Urochloa decumbens TaxID=240449 RepID=A0ABC8YTQ8_9POAL
MADLEACGTILDQSRQFSALSKKASTTLHAAIVTIILFVIIFGYLFLGLYTNHCRRQLYPYDICMLSYAYYSYHLAFLLIQLVAFTAIGFLYICNSTSRKEKTISAGFLALLALLVFLISWISPVRLAFLDVSSVFRANIVAISSYCFWKLYPTVQACLRGRRTARGAGAAPLLETAQMTTFRIEELLREFSSNEIRAMTQDFGIMIGQGGFAQVFRGSLDDGTAVAVKSLITSEIFLVTGDADFLREVSIIANVHHRSLVRLLGYCLPRGGGGRYLVYPFFENGSLDRWLFHGGEEKRRLLTWPARRCIAVDVARALAYLHHECHRRILHLDVKPGNILLDGSLRAHVSDFGISVSVARDLTTIDTHGRGTFGYMAPEMLVNAVSDKSDVYSYGMTLLELVGGRRNFEPSSASDASSSATPDLARDFLPSIVLQKMARGELMEAVDAAMADVDEEAVELVVKVALCCIQRRRDMRPSMLAVVDMLEGRVDADLPPESRPSSAAVDFPEPLSSSLTHGR